ncbi:MAG: hypothetical protein ACO34E_09555 [Limisphaerales bacterium]
MGGNLSQVGTSAVQFCHRLSAFNVDPQNPYLRSIDGVLIDNFQNAILRCPQSKTDDYSVPTVIARIEDRAFGWCANLTSVHIGAEVTFNGTAEFLRQTVQGLPTHIRIGLERGDSGFGDASVQEACEGLGLKFLLVARLCLQGFWGTEALHNPAIAAYNLCVLLQRRLGQLEKCELNTLRWRLFGRAVVWSRTWGRIAPKGMLPGGSCGKGRKDTLRQK